jgi:hypothetical protein
MFRPKPVAALAVTAALAVAAPVTAASAATPERAARAQVIQPIAFTPPASFCLGLAVQAQGAVLTGNPTLANLLGQTLLLVGCGGAAI